MGDFESFGLFLKAAKAANEVVFTFLGYSVIKILFCFFGWNILFPVAVIELSFLFGYEFVARRFLYESENYQNYLSFWDLGLNFFLN
jgi:hypothetical protein